MSVEYVSKIRIGSGEEVDIKDEGAVRSSELFDLIYPVGSIYMSTTLSTASAVAAVFGGTWVAWGVGRVPVGVDTSQTEFNIVEKSSGSKYIQAHSHAFTQPTVSGGAVSNGITGGKHRHNVWYDLLKRATGTSLNTRNLQTASSGETAIYSDYSTTHTHNLPAHTHTVSGGAVGAVSGANTGNCGNLPPYITCYMWKRTA